MHYIGLLSGTSVDAIDACLIELIGNENRASCIKIIDTFTQPISDANTALIKSFLSKENNDLHEALSLDHELGKQFAFAANHLINKHPNLNIAAIGSHGQTIRHEPKSKSPYTLQIGSGAVISQDTKTTTINNFRCQDIANGGEGAPFAPAFHSELLHSDKENRCIINIGGISNITYLPKNNSKNYCGFDCGPGNTLVDAWIKLHKDLPFDNNSKWAMTGKVNFSLLDSFMKDKFIIESPPKSTGPEYFNIEWLHKQLSKLSPNENIPNNDIQLTLYHFTALSISQAVRQNFENCDSIYLCGGGANNAYLIDLISSYLQGVKVSTTSELGIDPNWVEACLFAWLAAQTLENKKIDLRKSTGCRKTSLSGCIWPV